MGDLAVQSVRHLLDLARQSYVGDRATYRRGVDTQTAHGDILHDRAVKQVGCREILADLLAQDASIERSHGVTIKQERALKVSQQSRHEFEQRRAPRAFVARDGEAFTSLYPSGQVTQDVACARMIAVRHASQFERHPGVAHRQRASTHVVKRQVRHIADLLGGGQNIVDRAHAQNQLFHPRKHRHNDQLGRHELSQRNLSIDDQLGAQHQKSTDDDGAEEHDGDGLLHQHVEVLPTIRQVAGKDFVHALNTQRRSARKFERVERPRLLLKPMHGAILVRRLHEARFQPTRPRKPQDPAQYEEQQHPEEREVGVVEGQQDQSGQYGQHGRRGVQQELREALLNGDRLKESIHRLRQIFVHRGLISNPRNTKGELERESGEHALLNTLHHAQLQDLQSTARQRADHHIANQDHHRLQDQTALHQLHNGAD